MSALIPLLIILCLIIITMARVFPFGAHYLGRGVSIIWESAPQVSQLAWMAADDGFVHLEIPLLVGDVGEGDSKAYDNHI